MAPVAEFTTEMLASLITAPVWSTTATIIVAVLGDCANAIAITTSKPPVKRNILEEYPTRSGYYQRSYYRMLTARAANNAKVANEIDAWIIINTLAQRDRTGASVGENAVLVLNARNR